MRGRSQRPLQLQVRLEEMLRSGANGARRVPSPVLRSAVRKAIESGRSGADRESVAEPAARRLGGFAAREPRRIVSVAAAMLVAIGFGVFAFLDRGPERVRSSTSSGPTASNPIESAPKNGVFAIEGSVSPKAFAHLARAGPRTLRTAVDDPLFAELKDIAEDATRTVRFLARRVPPSLVTRSREGSGR